MTVVKRLLLFLACLPIVCGAQNIELKQQTETIDGHNAYGFSVNVPGTHEDVKTSLVRFMKGFGKAKVSTAFITVPEAMVEGNKFTGSLYATAAENGKGSVAWIGVASSAGEESAFDHDLKKMAYNFAVTFQREQIQLQIDESMRALQTVEKQQTRLQNQSKDLYNKIENNKKEKIALEKALIDNKTELEDLTRRVATNAYAQDSVAKATEQIRKVVEMHRERQRKVK